MQIVSHMDSLDNHKVQEGREKETKNNESKEPPLFQYTLSKKQ